MRLLKRDGNGNIALTSDLHDDDLPSYAILSHTWGAQEDEVLLDDFASEVAAAKPGYEKIRFCAAQAQKDNLQHFWIDTCCINRSNSTELNEAIISMFRWYKKAEKCYVYLSDVPDRCWGEKGRSQQTWQAEFLASRWFTRGWTLQELLAPAVVEFFSKQGQLLGNKSDLEDLIYGSTNIPRAALNGVPMTAFSIDDRLGWIAHRSTKKPEDRAYCLFGICDVSTVPLYGEGEEKAFLRLRNEIDGKQHTSRALILRPQNDELESKEPLSAPMRDSNGSSVVDMLRLEQPQSRELVIRDATQSTCEWLTYHPAYATWFESSRTHRGGSMLWINGKPGAGKSTLMKHAVEEARFRRDSSEIVLSFFFDTRETRLDNSACGLYRSLLLQLLEAAPYLQDAVSHRPRLLSWTSDRLSDTLRYATTLLAVQRLTIFIDAVDECDESEARRMVVFFEELASQLLDRDIKLSTCLSSRYYPSLVRPGSWRIKLEHEPGHDRDLALYVDSHLHTGRSTGKKAESLRDQVLSKTNGVFLWAVCVVDVLNKDFADGRIYALQDRLNTPSYGLEELFQVILERDNVCKGEFLLCLQWIVFAAVPLKREEFYFAMVTGLKLGVSNWRPPLWDADEVTLDDMTRFVQSASRGLAEVTGSLRPRVQFVHGSIRDFLLGRGGLAKLMQECNGPTKAEVASASHEVLKLCCRSYLSINVTALLTEDEESTWEQREAGKRIVTGKAPLLRYACERVLFHADEAARSQHHSQRTFLSTMPWHEYFRIDQYLHSYKLRDRTTAWDLKYVLATQNCPRLLQQLGLVGLGRHSHGSLFGYPLLAAYYLGRHEAVRALLHREDPKIVQRVLDDADFGSGLRGRTSALRTRGPFSLQHLPMSSAGGLIACLISLGAVANPKCWDEFERDAQDIIQQGRISIFDAFMRNVERNRLDIPPAIRTCIVLCAVYDRHEFMRAILRNWTFESARSSHLTTARTKQPRKLDLQHGGTLSAVFLEALVKGSYQTLELLIQYDARVVASDVRFPAALILSSTRGLATSVRLLLEGGVDPNTGDRHGTALEHAVYNGHEEVTSLLLQYGAEIDRVNDTQEQNPFETCWLERYVRPHHRRTFTDMIPRHDGHKGLSVIDVALQSGQMEVARLLRDCHGSRVRNALSISGGENAFSRFANLPSREKRSDHIGPTDDEHGRGRPRKK